MIKLPTNFRREIVDVTNTFKHYFVDEFSHVTNCYFDHQNSRLITIHPNIANEDLTNVEYLEFDMGVIENVSDLIHSFDTCRNITITTDFFYSYKDAIDNVFM